MKIQKLTLKNFRSHRDTELELDRFNFIRGQNGSGKSSIQMALEYLFTGRCAMTDTAGRGAESLIRSGEKEFEVSAALGGGRMICRRRIGKSQIVEIDGRRAPVDVAEAFIGKEFGSAELLSAALNVDRFVDMSAAEQQKFLARSVPSGQVDFPLDICEALRELNEELPPLFSIIDPESAYKRYRDLAAETTQCLNGLALTEKPEVPADLPLASDVERKLQDLRRERERLLTQSAEADLCCRNAQAQSTQAVEEVRQPEQDRAAELARELEGLNTEQRAIEVSLSALNAMNGNCPTCGQGIGQQLKTARIDSLSDRLDELDAMIQGAREELLDCPVSLELQKPSVPDEQQFAGVRSGTRPNISEGQLAIVTGRIAKAERVLEKIKEVANATEKWTTCETEKALLQSKLLLLNKLVFFFGPGGPAIAESRNAIRSLLERVNHHLADFGYECMISFDPYEVRISLRKAQPFDLLLKQLSESERFRFGIAFQVALTRAIGLRFVVIDRADALDAERRKMLTSLLLNSDLDQAIVLATGDDATPSRLPAGVRFINLNGRMASSDPQLEHDYESRPSVS